jgi:hypothetical protein
MKLDMTEFVPEPEGPPVSSVDARSMLASLETVSDDARRVGAEKVRGVATTRYVATLDAALQAEQLREAGQELGADLVERQGGDASVGVWVDRDGLIRRIAMTVPFELMGGPGAEMTMTIDLFAFGAAPEIDLPPEEASYDATELSRDALEDALG